MSKKRRFILAHHRSPGDIMCLTSLMRDIHLTYPGQYETDFNTTVKPIWDNNPYITPLWNRNRKKPVLHKPNTEMIKCTYGKGLRDQNKETIHFAAYFHRDFEKQTGIHVPVQKPHGDLHLTEYEKATSPVNGRYWLILSGGKSDFPIKVWYSKYFQEVSDRLGEMGFGVVQTGATSKGHWHPRLKGDHVVDLVGWGTFREFVQQIYHAEGVICGVTAAMHMAAALHKPCVVLGGGREAWWWEAYVNENKGFGEIASGQHPMPHQYLHTMGLLPCCKDHGCWKNKTVKINKDKAVCKRPIMQPEMPVPECMMMITPDHVMDAVMKYYTDISLPPVSVIQPEHALIVPTVEVAQPLTPQGTIIVPPISLNVASGATERHVGAAAQEQPGKQPMFNDDRIMDHDAVGSKLTAFILFYGGNEYHALHQRCLESFINTVPMDRIDLRVGSNALCPASVTMIDDAVKKGLVTKHYRHVKNDLKYPVMQEMFNDPALPITTKWVLWFDDDSICNRDPNWLRILAMTISQHTKGKNAHMLGSKMVWTVNKRQKKIFESSNWWQGRDWQSQNGKPSPNGNKIVFASGGFWAITHEAIKAAQIPDLNVGLTHTGGDWQIGCQLYQAGYGLKQFNGKKQFIFTSSVKRRGITAPTVDKVTDTPKKQAPPQPIPRLTVPVQPNKKASVPQLRVVKL